jgi:transposase
VAIVAGTKVEDVIKTLWKLPEQKRNKIEDVTLDLASNMQVIVKRSFPNSVRVTDRFHFQKLATEAVQDLRIKHRLEALDLENNLIERARSNNTEYKPQILKNGDMLKQLLARSINFLYKSRDNWTELQKHRAEILFYRFPDIEIAYNLSADFRNIFNKTKDKVYA